MIDFQALLDSDPATALPLDRVLAAGRRAARARSARRRGAAAVLSVGLAATVGSVAVLQRPDLLSTLTVASAPASAPPAPTAAPTAAALETLQSVITAASPAGWTFTFGPQLSRTQNTSVVGFVDDGRGSGYLVIAANSQAGSLAAQPCHDVSNQAERCTQTARPDGSIVAVREVTADPSGVVSTTVVLRQPDGSGVSAQSTNASGTFPAPDEPFTGALAQGRLTPTRSEPVYSPDQLLRVVEAAAGWTARPPG